MAPRPTRGHVLRRILGRSRPGHEQAAAVALQRLSLTAMALLGVLIGGTLGHMLLNRLGWFQSFYFTLFTLAGIGYEEPSAITDPGRAFNSVIIVVGLTLVAVATATLVQLMFELDLDPRRMFMEHKIENLSGHYILCGAGRVGRHIIDALRQREIPHVVIEAEAGRAEELREQGHLTILGDATEDGTLDKARVRNAKGLVAAAGDHAINAFIVLTAKNINPDLYVVARADDEQDELKMRKVGADKVIFPTRIGSLAMANALTRPILTNFLESALSLQGIELNIDEIMVDPTSELVGQTLQQANLGARFDVTAIAARRASGDVVYNPGATSTIEAGDTWVVVGPASHIAAMRELSAACRGKQSPVM